MGPQPAGLVPVEQLGEGAADDLGRVLAVGPPVEAEHRDFLDEQDIGRDLRHLAAGETDDQDAPAPGHAAHRGRERAAADGIEMEVGAAAVGRRPDPLDDVLVAVVDEVVGAVGFGDRQLLGAARGGDHGGAQNLADLDRGQADAAAGAVQGLAGG